MTVEPPDERRPPLAGWVFLALVVALIVIGGAFVLGKELRDDCRTVTVDVAEDGSAITARVCK